MSSLGNANIAYLCAAGFVRIASKINSIIGHLFSYLALVVVITCFTVVVQRYIFATTQLWMQDLYVWLNGAMFTAVAGFTLLRDEHVRVDIFYRPASTRTKAIIDIIGVVLFLLPFCFIVYIYGIAFVQRSWRIYEASANPGGMPGLFVLKSFIIIFAALITLQGVAMVLRSILVLGRSEHLLPVDLRYESDGSAH